MKTLNKESTLARAHSLMKRFNLNRLPVFEDDNIVGVISSDDVEKAVQGQGPRPLVVGNYMATPVRMIRNGKDALDIAYLFKLLLQEDRAKGLVLIKDGTTPVAYLKEDLLKLASELESN